MHSKITKRNAVKAAVTVVANSLMCQAVEEVTETFTDSDTHYVSLGVGTAIYFGRYHDRLMSAIDRVADRRIARKAEKEATATA
jgi:hypothetical protein